MGAFPGESATELLTETSLAGVSQRIKKSSFYLMRMMRTNHCTMYIWPLAFRTVRNGLSLQDLEMSFPHACLELCHQRAPRRQLLPACHSHSQMPSTDKNTIPERLALAGLLLVHPSLVMWRKRAHRRPIGGNTNTAKTKRNKTKTTYSQGY